MQILLIKLAFLKFESFSGKKLSLKFVRDKIKIPIKRAGSHEAVNILDFLKPPKCALSNPQTTMLAIIGTQLMHILDQNSPLCPPPHISICCYL